MSLTITTTVSLSSQSVANNTSTVTWKVKYKKSSGTYNNNGVKYYVNVDGNRVKSGTWKPKKGATSGTIASGTTTIKHNADGTHAQIRAYAKVYDTGFSPSSADDYSPYLSLPTIKRTYTVSYNANGGTGAPASQTKTYGVDLTLSSTVPTRAAYAFKGWAKSSTGAVAYPAGGIYKDNAAVTLYAVWELLGNVKIESYSAFRCDSSGNAADEGTNGKFICTYVLSGPGLNEGSVTARYRASDVSTWTNIANTNISHGNHSKPANTPSLSVNVSCSISNISQDKSYLIELTVTDSYGNTATASDYISQAYFTMDFLAGGKGIGIGTTASCDESKHPNGLLTCGMDADFKGAVSLDIAKLGIKDYIVEYGDATLSAITVTARWEKWASGKAVMEFKFSGTASAATVWTTPIYYTDYTSFSNVFASIKSGLFIEAPNVIVTSNASLFIGVIPYGVSANGIGTLRYLSVNSKATGSNGEASFRAVGRWK